MTGPETRTAQVCVVGGGPGGLMTALELARSGCEVVVVEQSAKFTRHFRGESISPDSVRLLERRGLMTAIEKQIDIERTNRFEIMDGGRPVLGVDFGALAADGVLPVELPQQILLETLADEADGYPSFTLLRHTSVVGLIEEDGRVAGVRCTGEGPAEIRAALTIGADGRFSKVREFAGLAYNKIGLGRDVLWFTLPFPSEWDRATARVRISGDHHALLLPTYPDMVRVGLNIPKGGLKAFRANGIEALHARVDQLAPELGAGVRERITSWRDVLLLDIFTTTMPRWSRPGLILIGDAAHTLSPILGQGVNHAIMDATTLAPLVLSALAEPRPQRALAAAARRFQRVREPYIRRTRRVQLMQERAFSISSGPLVRARQRVYRFVDSHAQLKRRIWRRVYHAMPS